MSEQEQLRKKGNKLVLDLACCKVKLYKNEKCRCKETRIIQKNVKIWNIRINNLPKIQDYNNTILSYNDIYICK